jgi:hypothetical protein
MDLSNGTVYRALLHTEHDEDVNNVVASLTLMPRTFAASNARSPLVPKFLAVVQGLVDIDTVVSLLCKHRLRCLSGVSVRAQITPDRGQLSWSKHHPRWRFEAIYDIRSSYQDVGDDR